MLSSQKPQTVAETLARGTELLADGPSGRTDAQILLAFTIGRDRAWLLAHGETFLSRAQADRYLALCRKRAGGMPVAYITGFAGFYGREFAVNEHVLIPRPESEHLVQDALAHLRSKVDARSPAPSVLTVYEAGIGSGAIGCTILAEVPQAALEGSDISFAALKVAEYNARRLNVYVRCKFYAADVVKPNSSQKYDVVIANLPYIPSAAVPQKPDPVGFEPRIALDGGADGLDHYRKLLTRLPNMLRSGGLALMEAAPPTIGRLAGLARDAMPHAAVEIRHDYAGLERYVAVSLLP
ncbi:MAG TPA: peptide chain release factor N(5)-glutamine methyltransferase [Candidatus Baltobacteraceae bacterium]|jgi:release factor glutamine methyltransferase|nr:peptide chain release factor N(5)-glutamine methyltransferase [Candidatus Baltobacteraceae bacterium]